MNNELITFKDSKPILDIQMVDSLIKLEKEIKELKDIQETYKKFIKEAMEEKNIAKIIDEIAGLTITYVPEQTNLEKFHKDKLQEEKPEVYDSYVTMDGKRSAYITIKVK